MYEILSGRSLSAPHSRASMWLHDYLHVFGFASLVFSIIPDSASQKGDSCIHNAKTKPFASFPRQEFLFGQVCLKLRIISICTIEHNPFAFNCMMLSKDGCLLLQWVAYIMFSLNFVPFCYPFNKITLDIFFDALYIEKLEGVTTIDFFPDSEMQNHIEKTLYSGHASYKVSLSVWLLWKFWSIYFVFPKVFWVLKFIFYFLF